MLHLCETLALHIVFPQPAQKSTCIANRANQYAGVGNLTPKLHLAALIFGIPAKVFRAQSLAFSHIGVQLPSNALARHPDVGPMSDYFADVSVFVVFVPRERKVCHHPFGPDTFALAFQTTVSPTSLMAKANSIPRESSKQSPCKKSVGITRSMILNILRALACVGDDFTFGLFQIGIPDLQARVGDEDGAVLVRDVLKVVTSAERRLGGAHAPCLCRTDVEARAPPAVVVAPRFQRLPLLPAAPSREDPVDEVGVLRVGVGEGVECLVVGGDGPQSVGVDALTIPLL